MTMAGLGVGLTWGGSILWLFAARIFGGVATANLGTASAYIADITKPEERAKGMGLIGAAFGLGFILGPGLGGGLSRIAIDGRHGAVPCFVAARPEPRQSRRGWCSGSRSRSRPRSARAGRAASSRR